MLKNYFEAVEKMTRSDFRRGRIDYSNLRSIFEEVANSKSQTTRTARRKDFKFESEAAEYMRENPKIGEHCKINEGEFEVGRYCLSKKGKKNC